MPDKMITTPTPTSHGETQHGNITKKAQMMKNIIGNKIDT